MSLAQGGDREAYEELMTEVATAIESYLRRRFAGTGESDFFEECVQESLLAIHRARHTYDARRPFRPWLFTIVRHKAIDQLRRRPFQRSEAWRDAPAPAVDPGDRLDGAALLEGLDAKYREALVLTRLRGHTLEEAAVLAGVSVTAMKTRVHRAIRAVRRRLRAAEGA